MTARRAPPSRAIAVGVLIALLGPPIGALLLLPVFLPHMGSALTPPGAPISPLRSIAIVMGYGYLLGGVPALACGLWLGVQTWLRGGFSYRHSAATAVIASLFIVVLMLGRSLSLAKLPLAAVLMLATIAVAMVLRAIFGAIRLVR